MKRSNIAPIGATQCYSKIKPYFTTSNSKMKKLKAKHNLPHPIYVWGITAAKYCPSAKDCKTEFKTQGKKKFKCFGLQAAYLWPVVAAKYEWRAEQSKSDHFVEECVSQLARKRGNMIRLHDIGDFYSDDYLWKWINIMRMFPDKMFWCYTKEVERFKRFAQYMPLNFRYVFSFGGVNDALIDTENDAHSYTLDVSEVSHYDALGYENVSDDELRLLNRKQYRFYTVAH